MLFWSFNIIICAFIIIFRYREIDLDFSGYIFLGRVLIHLFDVVLSCCLAFLLPTTVIVKASSTPVYKS